MVSTILVNSYSHAILPAPPWDLIENYTYLEQDIQGWESGETWGTGNWAWGWSHDGTQMVMGINGSDLYYGFDLSTPFDMTTAVRNAGSSSGVVVPLDMWFSEDGLTYAQFSWFSANPLDFYTTTLAFEPTNANRSLIGTLNIGFESSQDMYGLTVSRDGIHIHFQTQGNVPDKFLHYKMSTPWDPSTAVKQTDELESTLNGSGHMQLSSDGRNMITSNVNNSDITHYRMTVGYDLDTATLVSTLTVVPSLGGSVLVWMTDDATQLIIADHSASPSNLDIQVRTLPQPDPDFNNVVLLIPFNGTDAATSTSDFSNTNHSLTFLGGAELDTAETKFGSSSLLLDGNNGTTVSADDHVDFTLGSGDYTVECWLKYNVDPSTQQMYVAKYSNSGANREWWLGTNSSATALYFAYSTDGSNGIVGPTGAWNPTTGQWYHLAASRSGNNMYVFADGVLLDTYDATGITFHDGTAPVTSGGRSQDGTYKFVPNGWIDDVRITKGVARYTSTFTPPINPHPTS